MGQCRKPPTRSNGSNSLFRRQLVPLDVCRSVATDPPLKRFIQRSHVSRFQHGSGDVLPPNRLGPAGDSNYLLPWHVQPELGEPFGNPLRTLPPSAARAEQRLVKKSGVHIDKVAQEVQFLLALQGADLDARDHNNTQAVCRLLSGGHTGYGVVIGYG
jgi:hypothetical protein